jgi:hypothetical protein
MSKPPSTVRECIVQLVHVIEATSHNYSQKEKANLMDMIRTELVAFLKLQEYINE